MANRSFLVIESLHSRAIRGERPQKTPMRTIEVASAINGVDFLKSNARQAPGTAKKDST
jgi:hypothetical protein